MHSTDVSPCKHAALANVVDKNVVHVMSNTPLRPDSFPAEGNWEKDSEWPFHIELEATIRDSGRRSDLMASVWLASTLVANKLMWLMVF
jgi:hypothetical protein